MSRSSRLSPGQRVGSRLLGRALVRPSIGASSAFYARFGLADPWAEGSSYESDEPMDPFVYVSGAHYFAQLDRIHARTRMLDRLLKMQGAADAAEGFGARWDGRQVGGADVRRLGRLRTSAISNSPGLSLLSANVVAPAAVPVEDATETAAAWVARRGEQLSEGRPKREPSNMGRMPALTAAMVRSSAAGSYAGLSYGAVRGRDSASLQNVAGSSVGGLLEPVLAFAPASARSAIRHALIAEDLSDADRIGVARRVVRRLRGPARRMATSELQAASDDLSRPLQVATARMGTSSGRPNKGLRTVLSSSPLMATLEYATPTHAPGAASATVPSGAARSLVAPIRRDGAHRLVPVAAAAKDVRTQKDTGRAGPVRQEAGHPAASVVRRPLTSRVAELVRDDSAVGPRRARSVPTTPGEDGRRGLAAVRTPWGWEGERRSVPVFVQRGLASASASLPGDAPREGVYLSASPVRRTVGSADSGREAVVPEGARRRSVSGRGLYGSASQELLSQPPSSKGIAAQFARLPSAEGRDSATVVASRRIDALATADSRRGRALLTSPTTYLRPEALGTVRSDTVGSSETGSAVASPAARAVSGRRSSADTGLAPSVALALKTQKPPAVASTVLASRRAGGVTRSHAPLRRGFLAPLPTAYVRDHGDNGESGFADREVGDGLSGRSDGVDRRDTVDRLEARAERSVSGIGQASRRADHAVRVDSRGAVSLLPRLIELKPLRSDAAATVTRHSADLSVDQARSGGVRGSDRRVSTERLLQQSARSREPLSPVATVRLAQDLGGARVGDTEVGVSPPRSSGGLRWGMVARAGLRGATQGADPVASASQRNLFHRDPPDGRIAGGASHFVDVAAAFLRDRATQSVRPAAMPHAAGVDFRWLTSGAGLPLPDGSGLLGDFGRGRDRNAPKLRGLGGPDAPGIARGGRRAVERSGLERLRIVRREGVEVGVSSGASRVELSAVADRIVAMVRAAERDERPVLLGESPRRAMAEAPHGVQKATGGRGLPVGDRAPQASRRRDAVPGLDDTRIFLDSSRRADDRGPTSASSVDWAERRALVSRGVAPASPGVASVGRAVAGLPGAARTASQRAAARAVPLQIVGDSLLGRAVPQTVRTASGRFVGAAGDAPAYTHRFGAGTPEFRSSKGVHVAESGHLLKPLRPETPEDAERPSRSSDRPESGSRAGRAALRSPVDRIDLVQRSEGKPSPRGDVRNDRPSFGDRTTLAVADRAKERTSAGRFTERPFLSTLGDLAAAGDQEVPARRRFTPAGRGRFVEARSGLETVFALKAEGADSGDTKASAGLSDGPTAADLPAYAHRAVQTSAWLRIFRDAPASRFGSVRGPGLMRALARSDRPEDVVQALVQRSDLMGTLLGELPSQAAQIVDRILRYAGDAGDALPTGVRDSATRNLSARGESSRSSASARDGALGEAPLGTTLLNGGPRASAAERARGLRRTLPSARAVGQDGSGSTQVMRLAQKLLNLIHLAETERRGDDASKQVRLAEDSLAARSEGSAASPAGLGAGAKANVNIKALQRDVLEAVLREVELNQQRRQEEPDVRTIWW